MTSESLIDNDYFSSESRDLLISDSLIDWAFLISDSLMEREFPDLAELILRAEILCEIFPPVSNERVMLDTEG